MTDIVLKILLILLSCWEIWLCYRLLYVTVLEKEYLSKWNYIVVYGSVVILGIAVGLNRWILFFSFPIPFVMIIILSICTWGIQRKDLLLKIGLVGSYFIIVSLMDYLLAFLSIAFCEENFGTMIYYSTTFLQVGIFSCTRLLMTIIILQIQIWKQKSFIDMKEFQGIFFIAIALGCVVLRVYQFGLVLFADGISGRAGIVWLFSLICIVFVFGIISAIWVKGMLIRQENRFLRQKEEMLHTYYQEIVENQERNRRLVHDMKNHLLVLKEYQQQGNLYGIGTYLEELSEELWRGKSKVWTGNQVTDIVLNQKKGLAEEHGICMEIKAETAENWFLSDRESCSIFGNLLDNAIEACEHVEGKRWIQVTIRCKASILFLEMANSMREKPVVEQGKFLTNKREKEEHGLGLESVRQIVERYDGDMTYQTENERFCVKISLYKE